MDDFCFEANFIFRGVKIAFRKYSTSINTYEYTLKYTMKHENAVFLICSVAACSLLLFTEKHSVNIGSPARIVVNFQLAELH